MEGQGHEVKSCMWHSSNGRAFHKYQVTTLTKRELAGRLTSIPQISSHNLCKERGCSKVNRDPSLLAQKSQTEQPKMKVVLQTKSVSFDEEQILVEICFLSNKKTTLFWPKAPTLYWPNVHVFDVTSETILLQVCCALVHCNQKLH